MNDSYKMLGAYLQAREMLPKTRQIVMLYEGVIRFVAQAADAIKRGDIETRYAMLSKAAAVINGLHGSIDHKSGGTIATVLDGFYSTIYAEIMEAQRTNSIALCDGIISELKTMKTSWEEIDRLQYSTSSTQHTTTSTAPFMPLPPAHEGMIGMAVSV